MLPKLDRQLITAAQGRQGPKRDAALTALVDRHKGLVHAAANKYYTSHLESEDLVQEGMIGLLEAIRRYDLRRDLKFSTYAMIWIRAKILRVVPVSGPRNGTTYWQLRKTGETEATPTLAKSMRVSEDLLRGLVAQNLPHREITDDIAHDTTEDAETRLGEAEVRKNLKKAIRKLDRKEREILRLYFREKPLTFTKIGEKIGLSRAGTQNAYYRIVEKLRGNDRCQQLNL